MENDEYIDRFCRGRGLEIGGAGNYIEGLDSIKADNKDEYVGRKYDIDARLDGTDLVSIEDDSVDYVVSIHVLEHIPNPLKALVEWYRVVKPGGYIFTAVPQKQYTFDRYRNTTTIRHLLEDYQQDAPPNDTTHLEEFTQYSAPLIYSQRKNAPFATRAVALGLIRAHRGRKLLPLTARQRQLATRIDQDKQFQRHVAEHGAAVDIHHHVWSGEQDVQMMTDVLGMELALTLERYLGNSILFVIKVGVGGADFQANLQALKEGRFPAWVDRRSRSQGRYRQPSPLDAYLYSPRLAKLRRTFSDGGAGSALDMLGTSIRRRFRA